MPKVYSTDEILGRVFDRLTVISDPGPRRGRKCLCRCVCGNLTTVLLRNLVIGKTRSCGCYHGGHGGRSFPEYPIWSEMLQRCFNPHHPDYGHYGGRGITVWIRWRESYAWFITDVGPRPGPGYSIDRIDNNGDYEPANVAWRTQKQQMRNTRANNLVTVGGETKCMAEWVELTGIKRGTLQFRIKNHWPESRLFDKANPILGRFTARGTPRPVA